MKQRMIIKAVLAVAMMFTSSTVMADKLEIQDSTIIVVGKGQTNKKGVFIAADSTAIDEIVIDEIVITYANRKNNILSITDSLSKKSVFSHKVKNSMTKSEMDTLCFSLFSGNIYVIQHGSKNWIITIPSQRNANKGLEPTDSVIGDSIEAVEHDGEDNGTTKYSWLFGLLGIISERFLGFHVISFFIFMFIYYTWLTNRKEKETLKVETTYNEEAETVSKINNGDEDGSNGDCNPNTDNKSDKTQHDTKEQTHKKTLQRVAILLGLREDQLQYTFFENAISKIHNKSNGKEDSRVEPPINDKIKGVPLSQQVEDIYTAREEVAKELLRKFLQRPVFNKAIEQAKKKCYGSNPKENEILQNLIDEIAKTLRSLNNQTEEAGVKNNLPINETDNIESSDSYTKWLNNRLKDLFDFNYDESESVRDNIERLIHNKTEEFTVNSKSKESTDNIEIVIREALDKAKSKWESDSKKEKEIEIEGKNSEIEALEIQLKTKADEIDGLKTQLDNTNIKIDGLHSQIKGKEAEIKELNDKYRQEQQSNADALVDKLHRYTDMIEWLPMLDPCDNDEDTTNQCTDIENRLDEKLKEMKERLSGFTSAKEVTPEQTYMAIQKVLISEITIDESIVNSLCRLYAYSLLPFMTDMKREYGVRLRRKNVNEIYQALENLYIQFGIKFQLPSLFVMESKDADYENVTGQAYSELINLCPNVNNHCDNIDSSMKLKDVIVDIDRIGYIVNGVVQSKARILTF